MINILKRVNRSPKCRLSLTIISHASVLVTAFAYLFLLALTFFHESGARVGGDLPMLLLGAAVPFILVSLARHFINAPRPYELYDFFEIPPKAKRGHSFPSRHVFSSFVIATLAIPTSQVLAGALYLIGISLALSRVFLGIHFIRDVVAGALIGIISGLIAIFIF